MSEQDNMIAERQRLAEDAKRKKNWRRWGPYLSERQWGTVREDYSPNGSVWTYLPHDHARSRAYRWGEDGLLGFTDRQCRLSFAVALWNGNDPIIKERLFGLTGPEGNHGEDVKELYYYLDATPTYSYAKALYKYPQRAYPYDEIVAENAARDKTQREYEVLDTGVFEGDRYFDVYAEYAKSSPNDILIRITVANRSPDAAPLHLLATLWHRNTWVWGCTHEGCTMKPDMRQRGPTTVHTQHETLHGYTFEFGPDAKGKPPTLLWTENETNAERLFKTKSVSRFRKDAFNDYIVKGLKNTVNRKNHGTKVAGWYQLNVPPGGEVTIRCRLHADDEAPTEPFGDGFEKAFADRQREADEFYGDLYADLANDERRHIARQADAGVLWSHQFYYYVVEDWLAGDPAMPEPPGSREDGRNRDWAHLFARDVLSMPDTWEYPWFAAWDLAFHMLPLSRLDAHVAKAQLEVMLREWYMHPNGQVPAYEFAFGDVNPPVHAWACWRVFKMTAPRGQRDRSFLASTFQKLLMNFTWWVNRKDPAGRHVFSGGFLGLDNIGVFDRSRPLPGGGQLVQADATAWMAFYAATMLSMGLELGRDDRAYADMASKFFEHFVAIAGAINQLGGSGLWDERDGFYYDQLMVDGEAQPMRIRSLVGLMPLIAVEVLRAEHIEQVPGFEKRMMWFVRHRVDLEAQIAHTRIGGEGQLRFLLAIPSRDQLVRVLGYMLDENEFLSPFGIRSLSKYHLDNPYVLTLDGTEHRVDYVPGESTTEMFGGNSNWRGPVWFPVNYLIIEALQRYHYFYEDSLTVECPTGSGNMMTLNEVAAELQRRLVALFLPDANGRRPCHGDDDIYATDPHFRELLLFHEYFDGETGRGLGASHQTGWTALIARCLEEAAGG